MNELDTHDVNYCPRCGSEDIKKKSAISTTDDVVVYCGDCCELTSLSGGAYCMNEEDFE